ncbi:MAG TPA: hypothetical protein VE547_22230, partial [Mycobacteriales bacterium]|nr:hypothetical protein [Mycobacteriales bacterium]
GGFRPDAPDPFGFVEARRTGGDGRWRPLPALPTPRANLSAADLDGIVYAVGGLGADVDGDTPLLDVVERYDPATGSWASSPSMPVPRAAPGVAGFEGRLYVAGGEVAGADGWDVTDSVIAYDPVDGTWREVAPLPTARTRLRLVATGGHLYAVGGFGNPPVALPAVERYDPTRDTWDPVAPMTEPRGLPGAVAARWGDRDVVVVVGGGQGELFTPTFTVADSTEVYDVDADKWQALDARLPRGRVSLVCALEADGSVLAIGGATGEPTPLRPTALVQALALPTGREPH